MPFVDLRAQARELHAELTEVFESVISRAAYTMGPECAAFEAAFAEFCGAEFCAGVSSGTDAVRLALQAAGVGPGGEVIVPVNTFIATAEAVSHCGATPTFVDCLPDTANIDPSRICEAVTPRTVAILPVHLYGQPADMESVGRIAGERGLAVVDDACQAHGASFQGRPCGSMGISAAFSFYPGKNLGALGLAFGSVAGFIALPALAALLIVIGVRTFKLDQVLMVWRTGTTQAVVMSVTFLLTLLVPMQYAVLAGVGISVILFVARQSSRVRVVRWVLAADGGPAVEIDPPATLAGGEVVVLTPYGSLFFASAGVFAAQLPAAAETSAGGVVILRLRGKEDLGSTFIRTIVAYHDQLDAVGAHLVLTGVGERVLTQLRNTGTLSELGQDNVFRAEPRLGESLQAGLRRAELLQHEDGA